MLCIGINDALHVDKSVEHLRVASIFKVAILLSPGYVVLVNCRSQLQVR